LFAALHYCMEVPDTAADAWSVRHLRTWLVFCMVAHRKRLEDEFGGSLAAYFGGVNYMFHVK